MYPEPGDGLRLRTRLLAIGPRVLAQHLVGAAFAPERGCRKTTTTRVAAAAVKLLEKRESI